METNFSLSKINEEEVLNDDEKSFIQGLCIESHTRFCSKITKVLSKGSFNKKKPKMTYSRDLSKIAKLQCGNGNVTLYCRDS